MDCTADVVVIGAGIAGTATAYYLAKGGSKVIVCEKGEIAGEHTVSFIGDNDRIDLVHKATNRSIFVKGAVEASVFLSKQKPGLYSMNDVLIIKPKSKTSA